jgi:4-hydroxyphenylacetate 3-monooxygenase
VRDLESSIGDALAQYYQGAGVTAGRRIQRWRLAWDIVGESFGARQQLYERYVAGDPVHMLARRYLDYDKTAAVERVHTLLEVPRS